MMQPTISPMEALAQTWCFFTSMTGEEPSEHPSDTENRDTLGTLSTNDSPTTTTHESHDTTTPATSPGASHDGSQSIVHDKPPKTPVQIGLAQSNTHMSLNHGVSEDSDGSNDSNNIIAAILAGRKPHRDVQTASTPVTDLNLVSTSTLETKSVNPFAIPGGSNLKRGSFIIGNFLDQDNRTKIPTIVIDDPDDPDEQNETSTQAPTLEVYSQAKGQEPTGPERPRKRSLLTEENIEAHNSINPPMCSSKSRSKRHKSAHRHRHRSKDDDREKNHSTPQVGSVVLPRHTSTSDSHSRRKKRRREEADARGSSLQITPVPLTFDQQRAFTTAPQSFDQQRASANITIPKSNLHRADLKASKNAASIFRAEARSQSFGQQRSSANITVPESILHRENYKAIKNTPITAGAKARTHLDEIHQRRSKNQATTADEDLFRAFEARQPELKRTQIVDGLAAPEKQVELPCNNYLTPAKTNEASFGTGKPTQQPRTNVPKKQNFVVPPPKQPQTQKASLLQTKNEKLNAARSKAQPQPQEDSPPPDPSPRIASPPVETVSAEEFLGPERLVRQWVVYRTPRFAPTITSQSGEKVSVSRDVKAIRCSDHISRSAANAHAHARYERIRKDTVKKSWEFAGEAGLYDGVLGYSDGDVQHFWVVEETADLTKISNQWKEAGKSLRLDQERAKVYSRKRYDVWSVVVYPPDVQGSSTNVQEQVLVVDCGGEDDGDGDEDEEMDGAHDDSNNGKEDLGGSRSPASSDTVVEQEPTSGNDTEKEQPEPSPESPNVNQIGNNPMVSIGVNTDETSITATNKLSNNNKNESPTPFAAKDHTTNFNPFTIISPPKVSLHASYTTGAQANKAALAVFLDLSKPRNARIEDHHYYESFLEPEMTTSFYEDHAKDPDTPVTLSWEASADGCKWEVLHLEVQVVESELEGIVDLGGIAVDGGPGPVSGGGGGGGDKGVRGVGGNVNGGGKEGDDDGRFVSVAGRADGGEFSEED